MKLKVNTRLFLMQTRCFRFDRFVVLGKTLNLNICLKGNLEGISGNPGKTLDVKSVGSKGITSSQLFKAHVGTLFR